MSSTGFTFSPASCIRRPFSGRVVLAHSDDLQRAELGARLSELGFEVRFATDSRAAQQATLELLPDLLLIDMEFAAFGGAAAVRGLRAAGFVGQILALLSEPWPQTMLRCQQAGCDQVLDPATAVLELKLQLRVWLERAVEPAVFALAAQPQSTWSNRLRSCLQRLGLTHPPRLAVLD